MQTPAQRIFLLQGDIYCERESAVVSTILGSCVSLCLWDSRLRFGGINHYVLPGGRSEAESQNTRYGDVAIDFLYKRMLQLGSRAGDLQAKIFGGASVFPLGARRITVGERNAEVAITTMRAYQIPVIARRTGGVLGRQIIFESETGKVVVREFGDSAAADRAAAVAPDSAG